MRRVILFAPAALILAALAAFTPAPAPASTPEPAARWAGRALTLTPRAATKYKANFSAVALTAATPKSTIGIKAPANQVDDVKAARVSFDGTNSAHVGVLVEWCSCTWATNSPGTNSTSVTPVQISGPTTTVQTTAAKAWSAEPTVLSVMDSSYITPAGGVLELLVPQSVQTLVAGGSGFVIRLTAPDAVNVSGYVAWEE